MRKTHYFALIFLFSVFYNDLLLNKDLLFCAQQKFVLRTADPEREITFFAQPPENQPYSPEEEEISRLYISMGGEEYIPAIFFNRYKDKVIVVGQGFPGLKEWYKPIARLFKDYDVILFDYRWKDMCKFIFRFSTFWHPVDTFFFREKEVVAGVVNFLKKRKKYEEIVALGECYSNLTFVLAQAEAEEKKETLFTRLILDSCWHNSRDFVEEISFDPWLPCRPQTGGAPNWLKAVLKSCCVHWPIGCLLDICTPNISVKPYLEKVSCPILFIHGQNDKMVPLKKVFEKIWVIPESEKALLVTPFEHSANTQNPEIYKRFCDCFIDSEQKEIGQALSNCARDYKEKQS